MDRIKKKYQLILLILLPFIILMGFIIKLLFDDYKHIKETNQSIEIFSLGDDIGSLLDSLEQENLLSLQFLKEQGSPLLPQELIEARNETDTAIRAIQLSLQNLVTKEPDEFQVLIQPLEKIMDRLQSIKQKRDSIDSRTTSIQEVDQYFERFPDDILDRFIDLGISIKNTTVFRNVISQAASIEERLEQERIGKIVSLSLPKGSFSLDEYNQLLIHIGKKEVLENTLFSLIDDQQESLYKDISQTSTTKEKNRILNYILSKGPNTPLDISSTRWQEVQASAVHALKQFEVKLMEENEKWAVDYKNQLVNQIWLTLGIILLTLLLTFYFTFTTLRALTSKLQQEADVLGTSGAEILSAINHASSATSETAAAVTETTTTVEELRQTAQVSAEKAKNVSDVSHQTLDILKQSEGSITQTIKDMHRIQDGMNTISQNIIKLSEHSQAIGNIIDTVNDLAEQSHLLAVNAAIEAAKAGEHGRGFAIVAQEVRSLAEQSKQATFQVKSILQDIQNSTSAAVMSTEQGSKAVNQGMEQSTKTNQAIRQLANEVENVVQAASQIAVSSQQQLVGVEQVNIAMANIKDASNLQVDHMRQIEAGIQGLNDVGQNLKELIRQYQI